MKANIYNKKLDGRGMRFGVVRARFNKPVTDGLLRGCLQALQSHGVSSRAIDVVEVPGSFEIPFMCAVLAKSGEYDAIITIGAVIKGETKHDEYIANAVAYGITQVGIDTGVPVVFGVITPNNLEQALARAEDNEFNKGREAALAAIEMVTIMKTLKH